MIEKSICNAMHKVFLLLLQNFSENIFSVGYKIDVDDFNNFFVQVGQSLETDIPCILLQK